LKNLISILLLSAALISGLGCAASPRFTSDDKENTGRYDKENKEKEGKTPVSTTTGTVKRSDTSGNTTGVASFYSEKFHGKKTANGETYDMYALTAAHETYPFNTIVKVTNLKNNKSVTLRINDRKPDLNGRIIDISYKAAQDLDMVINGIAHVQVEVLEWGK
jgi:rare lipoprotein A